MMPPSERIFYCPVHGRQTEEEIFRKTLSSSERFSCSECELFLGSGVRGAYIGPKRRFKARKPGES